MIVDASERSLEWTKVEKLNLMVPNRMSSPRFANSPKRAQKIWAPSTCVINFLKTATVGTKIYYFCKIGVTESKVYANTCN